MDTKINMPVLDRDKNETLENLYIEMKHTGYIPKTPVENENWLKRYEKWTSALQKTYGEALKKENLEETYVFNRKMGPLTRRISLFAHEQGHSYLYAMGMFAGVFFAMAGMLPARNKEQIFNIRMSGLKNRAYVKPVLEILYESDRMQHKDLCERVNASPSQLNRTMGNLIDTGCIKRYKRGKYSFYTLTPMGRKYTREILGYRKKEYVECIPIVLAGKKPQIWQKEQQITARQWASEYRISDSDNNVRKNVYRSAFER